MLNKNCKTNFSDNYIYTYIYMCTGKHGLYIMFEFLLAFNELSITESTIKFWLFVFMLDFLALYQFNESKQFLTDFTTLFLFCAVTQQSQHSIYACSKSGWNLVVVWCSLPYLIYFGKSFYILSCQALMACYTFFVADSMSFVHC